jgi:hypothetical protein
MAFVEASGTQTATVTTEHTLRSVTSVGIFQLYVDCVQLATGDAVELRCYQIILNGGTKRLVQFAAFYGGVPASDPIIKVSEPLGNNEDDTNSLQYTLKQTFGTSRDFPWKVLNLASAGVDAAADALLARNVSGGSSTGRIVSQALHAIRNKVDLLGGVVYDTDDSTVSWTFTVASDSSTDRVISVDPA